MIELEISFEDLLRTIRKIAPQLDSAERRFLIDEIERARPKEGEAPPAPSNRQSLRERVAAEAEAARKAAARPEKREPAAPPPAPPPAPPKAAPAVPAADVTSVTSGDDSEWFRQFALLLEAPRQEASKISADELETLVRRALEEVVDGARAP